jgi:hypothetical protein
MKKERDIYNYKGWLTSNLFIKRMLAVVGYYMVAQLLIILTGILLVLIFVIFNFLIS